MSPPTDDGECGAPKHHASRWSLADGDEEERKPERRGGSDTRRADDACRPGAKSGPGEMATLEQNEGSHDEEQRTRLGLHGHEREAGREDVVEQQ